MIRPTLIIALGGTGTKAVLKLQDRFRLQYGTPNPPGARFQYIDTHSAALNELTKNSDDSTALSVSGDKLHALQKYDSDVSRDLQMGQWFDPVLRANLTNQNFGQGVLGVRMYGRLALLASDNLGVLKQKISDDLASLRAHDAAGRGVNIYVVTSGGGGTGSGIFLDIGYLLKVILNELGISGEITKTEGIAAIAVPSFVAFPNQKYNSAAMLSELDYYCEEANVFTAVYSGAALNPGLGKEAPYDMISLVSPTQEDQLLRGAIAPYQEGQNVSQKEQELRCGAAMEALEQKIADYIFVRSLLYGTPFEERLPERATNWTNPVTKLDGKGYPNRFLTFGVALRQFPVGLCEQMGYSYAVSNFVTAWVKKAGEREETLDPGLLERPPLAALYAADYQAMLDRLGLPAPHLQNSTERRQQAEDAIYKELIKTNGGQALDEALTQGAKADKIQPLFDYGGQGQPVQAGSPGYIQGTLDGNRSRLTNRHDPESLLSKTRAAFIAIALDRQRGPRYALSLLESVVKALESELAFLEKVPQPAGVQTDAGAEARIQRIERDHLLLMWSKAAADRERLEGGGSGAAYANARYDYALASAKAQIYRQTLDSLTPNPNAARNDAQSATLRASLKNLILYLTKWGESQTEIDAEMRRLARSLPPGTVYSAEIAEAKWNALQPDIRSNTLDKLQKLVIAGGLDSDVPRKAHQEIDFESLEPVAEAVRDNMKKVTPEAESSIYGESVIRLLNEQAKKQSRALTAVADELAADSRPLLNLRLGTPGYENLLTEKKFAFDTSLWYFIANPTVSPISYGALWPDAQEAAKKIRDRLKAVALEPLAIKESGCAAVLFIRAAFPTRIINQYDPEARLRLLYPAQRANDTQSVSSSFGRTGIGVPLDEAQRDQGRVWLLVGEILRRRKSDPASVEGPIFLWDANAGIHTYQYRLDDHSIGILSYSPSDFEKAAYLFAVNDEALSHLRGDLVRRGLEPNQTGLMAQRLAEHLSLLADPLKSGPTPRYFHEIDMDKVDFETARKWLRIGAKTLDIPLDSMEEDVRWTVVDDNEVRRCKQCGKPAPSGGLRECPHCKFPSRVNDPAPALVS